MTKRHIVITGSSGQIGTNLGITLQAKGWRVTGIDRRANAWTRAFETLLLDLRMHPQFTFEAFESLKPVDCIVHLAANAKVFELVEHPERALDNITMAFNAFEAARRLNAPVAFGSSREVYGDIHYHLTHEALADFAVAESPYSASKISGEAMLYAYGRCYDLAHLVFRFSNVYGRYDNDLRRMERVIPLFIDRILKGAPITLYGPDKVLDFTYVDDCVAGIVAGVEALLERRISGEVLNLASGRGQTLLELVGFIETGTGRKANMTMDRARAGEIKRYVADLSRARELLGYEPRVDLEEGIRRTLTWWRENGYGEGLRDGTQPCTERSLKQ
jgi:UDP-glucose 4-epimerase